MDRSNKVRVRVKAPLPREVERYTIDRCCLQARLMPSRAKEDGGNDNGEVGDDEDADAEDIDE